MLILLACTGPSVDSADTAAPATPRDDDGDTFPAWEDAADPTGADCDDMDAAVTPATERLVPAGPFLRGRDDDVGAAPARTIRLSAYCIDVHEVTNTDYVAFLDARAQAGSPETDDEGRPLYDFDDFDDVYPERILRTDAGWAVDEGFEAHPVVEVWHWGAAAYCAWRGKALPTEAQWEKAARSHEDRLYPWGDEEPDCTRANTSLTGDPWNPDACVGDTTPVGAYPDGVGAYGALDLGGNVGEWVHDWYDPDYYATSPDEDPEGPESGVPFEGSHQTEGDSRLARGGNYLSGAYMLQTFVRAIEPEDATSNGLGFRCARGLE